MNQLFNTFRWFAAHAAFLLSFSLFLLEWKIRALSQHGMDGYDGALKLLPWVYTVSGLVPYQDFGLIYPPGVFFLAHIIPLQTLEQRNMLMYGLFLLVILVSVGLMYRFHSSYRRLVCAVSGFLLLSIPLLDHEYMADPLLALLLITVVFSLRFRAGIGELVLLFLFPFLTVYWRWDRILLFFPLEILCLMPFVLSSWRNNSILAKKLIRVLLVQIAGLVAGVGSLMLYIVFHGGWGNGIDFLYFQQVQVVMPYRDLPLPYFFSYPGILFFVTWSALALFGLSVVRELLFFRRKDPSFSIILPLLVCAPLAALPYALGRSDGVHIHPMLFLTGLSISIALLVWQEKRPLLLPLLLVLLIAPALWFLPIHSYNPDPVLSMTRLLDDQLSDCRKKTEGLQYRSLFVGRTLYERYFANNISLYFLSPSIPPATRYFSDDPGLQSSCLYGERIAGELNRAPKPMLAFITDQPMDRYEENKTQGMKSCGKIEAFLASQSYRIIGMCQSYETSYEIRVYEEKN